MGLDAWFLTAIHHPAKRHTKSVIGLPLSDPVKDESLKDKAIEYFSFKFSRTKFVHAKRPQLSCNLGKNYLTKILRAIESLQHLDAPDLILSILRKANLQHLDAPDLEVFLVLCSEKRTSLSLHCTLKRNAMRDLAQARQVS